MRGCFTDGEGLVYFMDKKKGNRRYGRLVFRVDEKYPLAFALLEKCSCAKMMCNLFEFKDMKMNFFIITFMLRSTFSDVHQSMCFCDTIFVNFSFHKFLDFSRGKFPRF